MVLAMPMNLKLSDQFETRLQKASVDLMTASGYAEEHLKMVD